MMVQAVIEIEKHSNLKYEQKNGTMVLDRLLNQKCPEAYGYIPFTMAPDGDPLDIFVICDAIIPRGTRVNAKVLGVFRFKDNGEQDDKVVAYVPGSTQDFIEPMKSINRYLTTYKSGVVVESYVGSAEAEALVNSLTRYER